MRHSLFGSTNKETWSQFAASINAQFIPGSFWRPDQLVSQIGPWPILLKTFVQSNAIHTRICALYWNKDDFTFRLYRKGGGHTISLWFGRKGIPVDDEGFDERLVLKSKNPEKARLLFCDPRIKALVLQQPQISFKINRHLTSGSEFTHAGINQLNFQCKGVIEESARLESLFELYSLTLVKLTQIGCAFEKTPYPSVI